MCPIRNVGNAASYVLFNLGLLASQVTCAFLHDQSGTVRGMVMGVSEGFPVHHGQRHSVQHCGRLHYLQHQGSRRQRNSFAHPTHLCRITNQHTFKEFPNQLTGTRVQAGPHSSGAVTKTQCAYPPTSTVSLYFHRLLRRSITDSASETMPMQDIAGGHHL